MGNTFTKYKKLHLAGFFNYFFVWTKMKKKKLAWLEWLYCTKKFLCSKNILFTWSLEAGSSQNCLTSHNLTKMKKKKLAWLEWPYMCLGLKDSDQIRYEITSYRVRIRGYFRWWQSIWWQYEIFIPITSHRMKLVHTSSFRAQSE